MIPAEGTVATSFLASAVTGDVVWLYPARTLNDGVTLYSAPTLIVLVPL